jgi:hypothetical protein
MWSCRNWPMFQRCLLPPSSGWSSSYSLLWKPKISESFVICQVLSQVIWTEKGRMD